MFVRLDQFEKAKLSNPVTDEGIVMFVRPVQSLNAESPIVLMVLGNVILVNEVHALKVSTRI